MMNRMLFSLDIGSSKIVSLVGSVGDGVEVQGIGNYYFTSSGKANDFLSVSNGVICDLESVGVRVTQVLNEAKINADCSVGSVLANISSSNVRSIYSNSNIELNQQSVSVDIIQQLLNSARQTKIPNQYEVLDYEVQEYLINKEHYTINPVNLTAETIESNLNMFVASSGQISNLKKVVRYSGFGLTKIVPSGILSGMAVLNHEEKQLGCCLIDIGAGTTDVVVYENGFIRYLTSIPIGGEDITRDIANVLKISRNLAEDVKINYGGASYTTSNHKFGEGITITDHRGLNNSISRKLLIDVITERIKDIFEVIKSGLSSKNIYDIINSGIIITGGCSLIPNIEDLAKHYFGLPVRIGIPHYSGEFADLVANPKYATSLGALYFANEYMLDEIKIAEKHGIGTDLGSIVTKIKGLFSK